ncbi:hypothetical protein, partial [Clostridium sp. UBA6640]|uniref:hypothetical protein n=1 Tax=Clostridium sp. UBA6640 TaxID=1946370 RepID=UPI0025C48752
KKACNYGTFLLSSFCSMCSIEKCPASRIVRKSTPLPFSALIVAPSPTLKPSKSMSAKGPGNLAGVCPPIYKHKSASRGIIPGWCFFVFSLLARKVFSAKVNLPVHFILSFPYLLYAAPAIRRYGDDRTVEIFIVKVALE